MTVNDLMKMVCDHTFGDAEWCHSFTKEEFYNEFIPRFLKGHTFSMGDDFVSIAWNFDIYQEKGYANEQDLAREVKDGYWVYTIFVSTGGMLFERYDDKTEAFRKYQEELKPLKSNGVNKEGLFTGVVDTMFIDTFRKSYIPKLKTPLY